LLHYYCGQDGSRTVSPSRPTWWS